MSGEGALPGEETAYRDAKVRRRLLERIRRSLGPQLSPGEEVQGLFSAYRMRRSVEAIVITDRRLLSLGDVSMGMPIIDEVARAEVLEVHVEREKILSAGAVTVRTATGTVGLGTIAFGEDTLGSFEEVLVRRARTMPVIPTPGGGGSEVLADVPSANGVEPSGPGAHPLVTQLERLADLHERGALDDEEFARAKARLLGDRPG